MAKPAEKARNQILAIHPGAVVTERTESSVTMAIDLDKHAVVTQIGAMHYDDNGWQEIDTTWQPSVGAWQYEMTTAPYQAYARDGFNVGTLVQYEAKSGEFVTFQPLAVSWRDEVDAQHQIATPQAVATVVTGDVLSWPNAYGVGRSMEWRAHPTRLQKVLRVETAADLPTPAAYLTGSIELELAFAFTYSATVTAFVDGVAWDKSTKRTTGNAVEFRNESDEVLWHFVAPHAWDSGGNETTGTLVVYTVGSTLHVAVRIPRQFVDASVFPLFVDPTVDVDVAAAGDDGYWYGTYLNATGLFVSLGRAPGGVQTSFFRFALAIPPNMIAAVAELTLVCNNTSFDTVNTAIRAEATDNATQITSTTDGNSRAQTASSVEWTADHWNSGTVRVSPDLSAAVSEVIGRDGWTSGAYLQVLITGTSQTVGEVRVASYEYAATLAQANFYVEYAPGTPVALTPDGFVSASGIVDQTAGTTNLHLAVDEGWATPDGDTTYLVNSGRTDGNAILTLSNLPLDAASVDAIIVRIRARQGE